MLRTVCRTCGEEWTGSGMALGRRRKEDNGSRPRPPEGGALVGPGMGWREGPGQVLWLPRGRCMDPGCEHKGSKFGTLLVNSTAL